MTGGRLAGMVAIVLSLAVGLACADPAVVANGFESLEGLRAENGFRGENAALELVDDRVEGERAVKLSFDSTDGIGNGRLVWSFPTTDLRGVRLALSAKLLGAANSIQVSFHDAQGNRVARHTWYPPIARPGEWVRVQITPGVQVTESSTEFAGEVSAVASMQLYTLTGDARQHAEVIFDALTAEGTPDTQPAALQIQTDVDYEAAFARTRQALAERWPVQPGFIERFEATELLGGRDWRVLREGGDFVQIMFREDELLRTPIRLFARTGLDGTWQEAPAAGAATVDGHTLTVGPRALDLPGVTVTLSERLEAHDLGLVLRYELRNEGAEAADVALRLLAPLGEFTPTELFDGLEVHADPAPGDGRATDLSSFPLSSVGDGRQGLALGLAGDSLNGFMESGLDAEGAFFYGTRLHIPAGQNAGASFVLMPYRADFGHLGAVERYYLLFPERFWPAPDVHTGLVTGIEGVGHMNSYWRGHHSREPLRRSAITHDWFYAPWKRPGDMWGRPELWDYEPGFPEVAARDSMFAWTPEELYAWRQERIDRSWEWGIATCSYIINAIESTLAQTTFADSMIHPLARQGVKSYDTDYRSFAWGGLYGRLFSDDLRRMCETANTTGFGHDNAFGHFRYRGPFVDETPGAAYDEEGPYALDGQAIALQCDFLHSFTVRDGACRAGVKFNPGGEHDFYFGSMVRADNYMIEHRQLNAELDENGESIQRHWYRKLRMIAGHKFIGLHTSARGDLLGEEVDWRQYSRRDIERVYQATYRRWMCAGLAYGIALSPDFGMGCPPVLAFQRMMSDLLGRGWWPVHGVRTDAPVLCARYGEGGDAAIAIVNTAIEPVQATVTLDGSWLLEEGAPLVAPYDGGEIEQSVEGTGTTLSLDLAGRDFAVLEIRGAWVGDPARLLVGQSKGVSGITARVQRLAGGTGSVRLLRIAEHDAPSVQAEEAAWMIAWPSSVFRLSDQALESFPLLVDGAPVAIITPDEPNEYEARAAGWVAEYLRWWYATGAPEAERTQVEPAIVTRGQAPPGPAVEVHVAQGRPPTVTLADGRLTIEAPTGLGLQTLTDRVLGALDERRPWSGSFHPLSTPDWYPAGFDLPAGTVEMCQTLGLWGTLLPDLHYEEGLQ